MEPRSAMRERVTDGTLAGERHAARGLDGRDGLVLGRAVWNTGLVPRVRAFATFGFALLVGCGEGASSNAEASPRIATSSATGAAGTADRVPASSAGPPTAPIADASGGSGAVRKGPSMNVRKVDAGPAGDADALRTAIVARESELLACYAEARRIDRTLMGRISASFTLDSRGKARKIKATGDLPEAVRACVVAQIEAASLPRATADSPSSLVVEFEPGRVPLRLNGKPYYDATGEDVKAALKALGCTDLTDESGKGRPRRYRAMLEGKHLVVTFTPKTSTANPGAFHMSARQIADLRARSAVFQATDFILAMRIEEDADTTAADALLRRIVTEE